MQRRAHFTFTDFEEHIDLSFLDDQKVSTWMYFKGQLRSNGKTIQPYHSIDIFLNQELPDDYNERILSLISAVGGADVVRSLVLNYRARISAIALGIPTKSGDAVEDGYISRETMQLLCDLGIELHFYYT